MRKFTTQRTLTIFAFSSSGRLILKGTCRPLTRCRAANDGKVPQDNAVEYYGQRAQGCEGGLIISEATPVAETGQGWVTEDVP